MTVSENINRLSKCLVTRRKLPGAQGVERTFNKRLRISNSKTENFIKKPFATQSGN